jgi:hypothetical protein
MKIGTTTFSFTNEWLAGGYTLERLLTRVADLGLGPGIEVIGYQAWRRYPELARDEVLEFRRLCDRLALEPAALGAYVDLLRRVDRPMTVDEAVAFLVPQIATAEQLGFPVLRLHPAEVFERLLPIAERADVTLATEIQGPQTPDHPVVASVLESRERLATPAIALALDFTVAMQSVPQAFVEALYRHGMAVADVATVVARWTEGATTQEILAVLDELGAAPRALHEALAGFTRFGRQDPDAWRTLVPGIAYAHAKFWELDDEGEDPTVRTAELLEVLHEGGYSGFVSGEWGGSSWQNAEDVDAFELVARHRSHCRRVLSEIQARQPVREAR